MAGIYEYIRTQGFEPLHFEEHYTRLEALSQQLFHRPLALSRNKLKELIAATLRAERHSARTMNVACVHSDENGAISVEGVEMIYNSFSLRALRPQGFICRLSGELLTSNTTAKEALLNINRAMAQINDDGVAIWVNEQNELLAIDGAPIIAVFDDEIRFSVYGSGVERDLALKNIDKLNRNINITTSAILLSELPAAKEILYIDHRGITALNGFEEHRYMDITAEKIANIVAENE